MKKRTNAQEVWNNSYKDLQAVTVLAAFGFSEYAIDLIYCSNSLQKTAKQDFFPILIWNSFTFEFKMEH